MSDIFNVYHNLSEEKYQRIYRQSLYEWGCERRAKRWFGWTVPYPEWTPGMRLQ